jgi:hypothetical protein
MRIKASFLAFLMVAAGGPVLLPVASAYADGIERPAPIVKKRRVVRHRPAPVKAPPPIRATYVPPPPREEPIRLTDGFFYGPLAGGAGFGYGTGGGVGGGGGYGYASAGARTFAAASSTANFHFGFRGGGGCGCK